MRPPQRISSGETRARLTFINSRLNDLTDAQIDTLVYPHLARRDNGSFYDGASRRWKRGAARCKKVDSSSGCSLCSPHASRLTLVYVLFSLSSVDTRDPLAERGRATARNLRAKFITLCHARHSQKFLFAWLYWKQESYYRTAPVRFRSWGHRSFL